jgi:hypothetical protein
MWPSSSPADLRRRYLPLERVIRCVPDLPRPYCRLRPASPGLEGFEIHTSRPEYLLHGFISNWPIIDLAPSAERAHKSIGVKVQNADVEKDDINVSNKRTATGRASYRGFRLESKGDVLTAAKPCKSRLGNFQSSYTGRG